jgi:hypothetical protein
MGGETPKVTRERGNQDRKRSKTPEKRHKRKKPSSLSRKLSSLVTFGKALKEHVTRHGRNSVQKVQASGETIDHEVLSEVFSKFGIEAKIDKIEAEIDAERKARKIAARSKAESEGASAAHAAQQPLASHFDAYGKPAKTIRHSKYWTIAVSVLGVLLAIQCLFLFRHGIARTIPVTRPVLVSLCKLFGCALPLPRDISLIYVDNGDKRFFRAPDQANHYIVSVTLTNKADFPQAWPDFDLTLLDITLAPILRQTIRPEDWYMQTTRSAVASWHRLTPEQQANGIPPRSEVFLRIGRVSDVPAGERNLEDLIVEGVDPINFRIEPVYR